MHKIKTIKLVKRIILGFVALFMLISLTAYLMLHASLPRLDGEQMVIGLISPISIARDDIGAVTISADDEKHAMFALGYVHGQDRFFQMDLLRRSASGELSELLGSRAVEYDKSRRFHGLRQIAEQLISESSEEEIAIFQYYVDGVNHGLKSLTTKPFEYWLISAEPRSWTIIDSILVQFAMSFDLNDEKGLRDAERGLLKSLLAPSVFELLTPNGTQWDAALDNSRFEIIEPARLYEIDITTNRPVVSLTSLIEPSLVGSNNWAVNGSRTADGRAIVAHDMHLRLSVPNIWYKAQINFSDNNHSISATGVTLPGVPAIVTGSNGKVAWGFTNSYVDTTDLVELKINPLNSNQYLTPDGYLNFTEVNESILVKGEKPEPYRFLKTIWGPVLEPDPLGTLYAVSWIAQYSEAINANAQQFIKAQNLNELQVLANQAGVPPQNLVAVDNQGNAGWTIMGMLPKRQGFDPNLPADWSQSGVGWNGWLSENEIPKINNPDDGQIWTANARVIGGSDYQLLGDSGYALGARSQQIRDRLSEMTNANEKNLYNLMLDDEAIFLKRWQALALAVIKNSNEFDPQIIQYIKDWGGHAAIDSIGYRIVRAFRLNASAKALEKLLAPITEVVEDFRPRRLNQLEDLIWLLVTEKPSHLLSPNFNSWQNLLEQSIKQGIDDITKSAGTLEEATWGNRNTVRVNHPFAANIPVLGKYLNMPQQQLPGDSHMPRVQSVSFGQSQRIVVSPGKEEDGFFTMPGGQSGHPLSPFYRAGHKAWADGEMLPFLPGPAIHSLVLKPMD